MDDQILVKFGAADALADEYLNWMRYLSPTRPQLFEPVDEVLLGECLTSHLPLSELAVSAPSLLPRALRSLVTEGPIPKLHAWHRQRNGTIRSVQTTTTTLIARKLDAPRRQKIRQQLKRERLGEFLDAESIESPSRGFSVKNHVASLLRGRQLRGSTASCALPWSAIHGDLNLDNVLVSVSPSGSLSDLAPIDYEHLGEGTPYEDLARLECELLVSALPPPLERPRLGRFLSDSGLTAVAAGWPWSLELGPPVGLALAEKSIFDSLRVVRQRALALAHETSAVVLKSADLGLFERGYFATLLARLLTYLAYPHVSEMERPRALEAVLLVADRLASDAASLGVRFPDVLVDAVESGRKLRVSSAGYVLDGVKDGLAGAGIRAALVSDVLARADVMIDAAANGKWELGLLKASSLLPQRSGPPSRAARCAVIAHEGGFEFRLESAWTAAPNDARPLFIPRTLKSFTLELHCRGADVSAHLILGNDLAASLRIPWRTDDGGIFIFAKGCRAHIRAFAALQP